MAFLFEERKISMKNIKNKSDLFACISIYAFAIYMTIQVIRGLLQ